MLKVIHISNTLPMSYPVDPTAEFEPGMIAQLKLIGNDVCAGVSDGTAPLGLIDDVRTSAFTATQIDEVIIIKLPPSNITTDLNNYRVSINEVTGPLENPHIIPSSFISTVAVTLNSVNGIITVPAGTELNYDSDGDNINDAFRIIVNYIYRITSKPGDDSTAGSGRITIHYQRGIFATDQFDTRCDYPLNASLYVGLDGKLTTRQPTDNHPAVAFVTGPPSAINGTLEFMWL